jgi:Arc/MetJ family transcription regulator
VLGPTREPRVCDTQECDIFTHRKVEVMRTNIDIDDRLMRQAMRSSRSQTKRAAVEEGLRLLIRTRAQATIRRLRGKIRWEGNLHKSRLGRLVE